MQTVRKCKKNRSADSEELQDYKIAQEADIVIDRRLRGGVTYLIVMNGVRK